MRQQLSSLAVAKCVFLFLPWQYFSRDDCFQAKLKLFSCYLLYMFKNNVEMYDFTCSLLTLN